MSATPVRTDLPPPLLGQHTQAVLAEWLGRDGAAIQALRDAGAI
jgi:crotonobetainyl-CoA:carnitine CoA-transferase CaiB-like acyl-CoA transferase